jgi:hypothetical protein
MPTWLIIVIVVIVVLAVGGAIAARRRLAANEDRFEESLKQVNRDLAAARAEDRGWEWSTLESAARRAYAERHDGADPPQLELVQVVDRPGTEEDKAVFRAGDERLTLGRREGEWILESLD